MQDEFRLELKLRRENPALHQIYTDVILCLGRMLDRYETLFGHFPDHSAVHSLNVVNFCNELIGDRLDRLNADEVFILLCACYFHDMGMGVSQKDFDEFSKQLPIAQYLQRKPNATTTDTMREFHHELSGLFIKKYAYLFEFPSEKHVWAIVQTARGHRRTDLMSEQEHPAQFLLDNGNVVRLPYLAALIRLADEVDMGSERTLGILYTEAMICTERDARIYHAHCAIKKVRVFDDCFKIYVQTDEQELLDEINEWNVKLQETIDVCRAGAARAGFAITQTESKIVRMEGE